jgi:hypothetical protein
MLPATLFVTCKSIRLLTVLSKPVPAAGEVSGNGTTPTPLVVPTAGAFKLAREVNSPVVVRVAVVPLPTAFTFENSSRCHVAFVCATIFSAIACEANTLTEPNLSVKVVVPGVVTTVFIIPLATISNSSPSFNEPPGSVNNPDPCSRVVIDVPVTAVPDECIDARVCA